MTHSAKEEVWLSEKHTYFSTCMRVSGLKFNCSKRTKKAISTWASQAVPHLSTNHALSRLTSEFEWDPVLLA